MLNLSKRPLTDAQIRFIDEMASLLTPWEMPQTAGRLYGYLLLGEEPASLDQIAADLEVSKSGACTAAKLLEKQNLARRYGERGSKRVLYTAAETFGGPLREQAFLLGKLEALIANTAPTMSAGAAATRLARLAQFYALMREAMEGVLQAMNSLPASERITPA